MINMNNRFLELLEKDCRLSSADLAVMLGKEEGDIRRLIEDYESAGVILGYKAIIDWDKTEDEHVNALIELRVSPQPDRGFDKIADKICNYPEVDALYLMSGGYDFMVLLEGKTMKEIAYFVAQKLAPLDSVITTATHFVLRKYKDKGVVYAPVTVDERSNCL